MAKLQHSLQNMQAKVNEANAMLTKEREAAQNAINNAAPIVKETQILVEDTKRVESLIREVEQLKVIFRNLLESKCCALQHSSLI